MEPTSFPKSYRLTPPSYQDGPRVISIAGDRTSDAKTVEVDEQDRNQLEGNTGIELEVPLAEGHEIVGEGKGEKEGGN